MGISTRYYTVYGIKSDCYDHELSEALYGEDNLYETIELCPDLDIIMDSMGGDYMIMGKILFDSGDLRWSDFKDTFTEINIDELGNHRENCTEQFMNYLPDFGFYMDQEWKLMTFVHYS